MRNDAPIGLFDSGEGGLTVARALAELLPGESLIYACDGAHFPYGPRPLPEVRRLFLRFLDFFSAQGCKLVVIACNTATAAALTEAVSRYPAPVLGVIEPGAEAAAARSATGCIGVLATQGTVNAGIYPAAIARVRPDARVVQATAPVLVTMAEAGDIDTETARSAAASAVAPLCQAGIDTLVLGCTHFPHMRAHLEHAVGARIRLIDPGRETAQAVRETLAEMGMLSELPAGSRRFLTTGDPQRFAAVAGKLWPTGDVRAAEYLDLPAPDTGPHAGKQG